jgi:tungstate transport system ATP-binding protein
MSVLEARDLSVDRGGREVARADHLVLEAGETLALLGPNGAGKTSLLLALASLLPSRGELLAHGEPIRDGLAFRRRIGVVFQRPLLLDRSALDNASLGLALRGVPGKAAKERARTALERLGIAGLAQRSAGGLSGGEAQRVSIARALALEPELLFLDEPFSGLDAPARDRLITDLGRVLRESAPRVATILVTHDRDEALALADRVAVVMAGRVRQQGRAADVFARPADETVAEFVGVENVLAATVERATDEITTVRVGATLVAVTEPPPTTADGVLLLIAPDDVVISRQHGSSSERNAFAGRITAIETIGRRVRITLDCGFPLVAHVTHQAARELALTPGETVTASFKATVPHLLARGRGN